MTIIVVKYGDEHSFIINPNCKVHNFYPYLKKKLLEKTNFTLGENEELELYSFAFRARSPLTNLRSRKPTSYVSDYLKVEREVYVPVAVKTENKQVCDLTLLYIEDQKRGYSVATRIRNALVKTLASMMDVNVQKEQLAPPPAATKKEQERTTTKHEKKSVRLAKDSNRGRSGSVKGAGRLSKSPH